MSTDVPTEPLPLAVLRAARERIAGDVVRTPLVRLHADDAPCELWLKLENLQPYGSFKLRGALNAVRAAPAGSLTTGVHTASAGNMAQGLAWAARTAGVPCQVLVPEHAPETKLAAIERLGASAVKVPFDDWWRALLEHRAPGLRERFVHPVCDPDVIAGNGTVALEIIEDLPDVDAVVVPFGGGGLSSGIGSALTALRPEAKLFAAEVATAAPLAASLAAGEPRAVDYQPSFVDGIGGKSVLAPMWPLVRRLVAGSLVASLAETARALRLVLERNRVLAEGAGAAAVAAALSGGAGSGRVVAVISGGNIDAAKLGAILDGRIP